MLAYRFVALGLASTLAACAVVDPPGWTARQALPVSKIRAKPWVMYGVAPHQWVSAFGEIGIVYDRWLTAVGPYSPGMRFDVRFRGSEEPGLTCQMYVEPSGAFVSYPETHGALFACVSSGIRGVVFAEGIGCRYPAHPFEPSCHHGLLRIGEDRFVFVQGFLKRYGAPVGYLSFTSSPGELFGAANIVSEMSIDLWMRPVTSEDERRRQRFLVLLTAALHQFHHATQ